MNGNRSKKACEVQFTADRTIEIDLVAGHTPGLECALIHVKGRLAGPGQLKAKIAFEFSFDDLPLEDYQRSTGNVLRWRLAGREGSPPD